MFPKIDWIGRSVKGTRRIQAIAETRGWWDVKISVELGGKNLDGSTLVIYNNPRNTIVIKAKLRFFFWHRSLSEAKTRREWNTTRLFIISTTDRHRPFCYKQLNEYVKQETESCCETHNILNETGILVCGNCGQIEGYNTVNEYLNFYENLHKIKKKSVYHRKCHIETHTLMFDLPPINKQTNIANIWGTSTSQQRTKADDKCWICLETIIQNVEATTLFHPNIKIKEDNQI